MGGESRTGWMPFIRRQWDDFTSALPSAPPPPPSTLDTSGLHTPRSWGELKSNVVKSGVPDFVADPYGSLKKYATNWWEGNKDAVVDKGEKIAGRVGAVTTAPIAKMGGTLMDVTDPRNTGSEKKPMSDVLWEGAKAVKHGLINPKVEQPSFTSEVGSRLPTEFGEGGDPLAQGILKLGVNNFADASNLGGGHLATAALGTAAHLAGMGAHGLQEAMIPMWLARKQKGYDLFTHADWSEGNLKQMMQEGLDPASGADILEKWMHFGGVKSTDLAKQRAQGLPPSSSVARHFGGYELPTTFPDNMMVSDLYEGVPKEDIELITSRLHPEKDAKKIKRIWQKWQDQAQYAVDPADQISGKVPFVSVQNDPIASQKVRELRLELQRGDVSGIRGLGGYGPLNHPDMPTSSNSPLGGVFYEDTARSASPQSFAADPRMASVSDPRQTQPPKVLGVKAGKVFPKGYVDESVKPFTTAPAPVPDFNQPSYTAPKAPTQGTWNPAPPSDKLGEMDSHLADLKSILEENGIDTAHVQNYMDLPDHAKLTYTPYEIHKNMVKSLEKSGHAAAADEVKDLWDMKVQEDSAASDLADTFHKHYVQSSIPSSQDLADSWHNLAPEAQKAYASKYAEHYKKNLKSAPDATTASILDQLGVADPVSDPTSKPGVNGFLDLAASNKAGLEQLTVAYHALPVEDRKAIALDYPGLHDNMTSSQYWKDLNTPDVVGIGSTKYHENKAVAFYNNVADNDMVGLSAKAGEWKKLDPKTQKLFEDYYPHTYSKIVGSDKFSSHNFYTDVATGKQPLNEKLAAWEKLKPEDQALFKQDYPASYEKLKTLISAEGSPKPYAWGKIGPKGKNYVKTNLPEVHAKIQSGELKNPGEIWEAIPAAEQFKLAKENPNLYLKLSEAAIESNHPPAITHINPSEWNHPNADQKYIQDIVDMANSPDVTDEHLAGMFSDGLNAPEAHALKTEYPVIYEQMRQAANNEFNADPWGDIPGKDVDFNQSAPVKLAHPALMHDKDWGKYYPDTNQKYIRDVAEIASTPDATEADLASVLEDLTSAERYALKQQYPDVYKKIEAAANKPYKAPGLDAPDEFTTEAPGPVKLPWETDDLDKIFEDIHKEGPINLDATGPVAPPKKIIQVPHPTHSDVDLVSPEYQKIAKFFETHKLDPNNKHNATPEGGAAWNELDAEHKDLFKKVFGFTAKKYEEAAAKLPKVEAPKVETLSPVASPSVDSKPYDVFDQKSGWTVAKFNSKKEAEDWLHAQPNSKQLDYDEHVPGSTLDESYKDYSTSVDAPTAPPPPGMVSAAGNPNFKVGVGAPPKQGVISTKLNKAVDKKLKAQAPSVIDNLKQDHPDVAKEFAKSSGTERGSIETHTKHVMDEWKKQFTPQELESMGNDFTGGHILPRLLETSIALHDIGKAKAIEAGSKSAQHKHTVPMLQKVLAKEGFQPEEIKLATELFNHDMLGQLVQGQRHDVDKVVETLKHKAEEVGMDTSDFVRLQMAVYDADAASYPYVRQFMKKDPFGKWTFSGHKALAKIEALKAK